MAATGPYIIYKSSQFCAAVRCNVGFDHPLRKRIREVEFPFPKGADTLPLRLNLESLTTAVSEICQQMRERREKYLLQRQSIRQRRKDFCEDFHPDETEGNLSYENQLVSRDIRLLGAGGFLWDKERVTDYELFRCKKDNSRKRKSDKINSDKEEWEHFINQHQLEVWRRPIDTTGLYEYKVFGTFFDINATSFYRTQVDNEYRLCWDQFVLKLDVVDSDPVTGTEVLHWVTKFPYPLRNRDYVFVRRGKIDHNSRTMVLLSRATHHPLCPENNEHVRVPSYHSSMVIVPHKTFDEDGFDFVLSYFDDPKTNFPSYCMNILTSTNLPTFIETLHNAAAGLNQHQEKVLQAG